MKKSPQMNCKRLKILYPNKQACTLQYGAIE